MLFGDRYVILRGMKSNKMSKFKPKLPTSSSLVRKALNHEFDLSQEDSSILKKRTVRYKDESTQTPYAFLLAAVAECGEKGERI